MSAGKDIITIVKRAKDASQQLGLLNTTLKNEVLGNMAKNLLRFSSLIKKANDEDLKQAKKRKRAAAFVDRLTLTDKRIAIMSKSLTDIAKIEDPVGKVTETTKRPNGLIIKALSPLFMNRGPMLPATV